jgi:hypothetical protein
MARQCIKCRNVEIILSDKDCPLDQLKAGEKAKYDAALEEHRRGRRNTTRVNAVPVSATEALRGSTVAPGTAISYSLAFPSDDVFA